MHPCLGVDEILRFLVRELVGSQAKASAVSLACCRKSFENPGLDVLWETQDRLLPLLESLPGDVWNEGECTVSAQTTDNFVFPQPFGSKVFQETPNDARMGSFPEVRSKNVDAQSGWSSRLP
jgi:hypothetical protein